MNTYFIFEDDGAYDSIMTFEELKTRFELVAKIVLNKHFGTEPLTTGESIQQSWEHQYDMFYELKTKLTIEQVKEVIEHDFYVDWFKLCKVIGEIEELPKC